MADKAIAQVDIVDVTDAYSVILTNDSHTFLGTTSAAIAASTTTQVVAMRGADQVAAAVDLTAVTSPTGVTVTKDTDATAPTLTIAVSTAVTSGGTVDIPVVVDGDITIHKVFSFAIAFTGATGADAITMAITSSNGTIFKNSSVVTTLTAHVYKGGVELTSSTTPTLASQGTISWYKDGGTTAVGTGQTLSISAGTVTSKASYVAKLA